MTISGEAGIDYEFMGGVGPVGINSLIELPISPSWFVNFQQDGIHSRY
jgi:hypothetical protein